MSILLALETSSPVLSIALKKDRHPLLESIVEGFSKHSENLLPTIDTLIQNAKIKFSDITTFLIGRGPGSFTGLRVGYATLKGFLACEAKPCFGAISIDLIAAGVPVKNKSDLAICLDAYRGKIYTGFFSEVAGQWQIKDKIHALSWEELSEKIAPNSYVSGDALSKYSREFASTAQTKKLHLLEESFWYPKAATLIESFESRHPMMTQLKTNQDFLPHYFRLSEAEERLNERVASR